MQVKETPPVASAPVPQPTEKESQETPSSEPVGSSPPVGSGEKNSPTVAPVEDTPVTEVPVITPEPTEVAVNLDPPANPEPNSMVEEELSTPTQVVGSVSTIETPEPARVNPTRASQDITDTVNGAQIHIIYAVPSGGVDRGLDVNGTLGSSLASVDAWLWNQTGKRLRLKLDKTPDGAVDITYVSLPRTDAEYDGAEGKLRAIQDDLRSIGAIIPGKIYGIYFEGGNEKTCGEAGSLENGHQVAIMFLQGTPGDYHCSNSEGFAFPGAHPKYPDYVMLHELIHVMGGPHVFDDPHDLMYGGNTLWHEFDKIQLDVGKDDYFALTGEPQARSRFYLAGSPFVSHQATTVASN
mgnify:CR=1 FL=1